jgi:tetratricopeptide (TPR) repeat protein
MAARRLEYRARPIYGCAMKLVGIVAATCVLGLAGCPNEARNESITAANQGNEALGMKQFDAAIPALKRAVERWGENHRAWYSLGIAYKGRQDWANATDALSHAVQLRPEEAMYQLVYGWCLYEKAIAGAREELAKRENKRPIEVTPDLSTVNFEKPLQHLQEAIKLNGELWRAHYMIGRIYRDSGRPKDAADELTKALKSAPVDPLPWVALAELYRLWDYTDQAIQVAEAGTTAVPSLVDQSDIWYEVGMGYDDKRLDDKAIEAFTKAIDAKRDSHKARFQRGQAYYRKGDYNNAKRDLLEFSRVAGASVDFAKQQASRMLIEIAAKTAAPGAPAEKLSPEDLVKKGKGK